MKKIIRNKGGRSKSVNPKTKRFTLRFTEDQWVQIQNGFENSKMYNSYSEMLIDRIINKEYHIKYTNFDIVEFGKIRSDINRIGSNINQIAKIINSKNNTFNKNEFYSNIKVLANKVDELNKVFSNNN